MEIFLETVHIARRVKGRWRSHIEDWRIKSPKEKLWKKYADGTTLLFDWYVFHYPRHEPDRITSVDLYAADRLMNARLSRPAARWRSVESPLRQKKLSEILRRIPIDAPIEDSAYDAAIGEAYSALSTHGVRLAIASKLLTIKRPYLIPMLDNVVARCFNTWNVSELLSRFRQVLANESNRQAIQQLASDIEVRFGIRPSPARVLDQLIWSDWVG